MSVEMDWRLVALRVRSESFIRSIETHDELASTNDRALALAVEPDLPRPALVLADRQTSGRGRGGNVWRSGPGALTFSLVIDRPRGLSRERMAILSLAAGLAARDAVASLAPVQRITVKWPNDVYLDGRKVCGILTEVPPGFPDRAVVGVGLNVNNSLNDAPEEVRLRAVSVAEMTGRSVDVGELLVRLLVRLEGELQELGDSGGLDVRRWSQHCQLTGRDVRLRTAGGEVRGRCLGVGCDGELQIETGGVPRSYRSGEVIAF